MDLNKYTDKSQEALNNAHDIAKKSSHSQLEIDHLLMALITQEDGFIKKIIGRTNTDFNKLIEITENLIKSKPRVSGSGFNADNIFLSRKLAEVLGEAEKKATSRKDDYISVEHIFESILASKDEKIKDILLKSGLLKKEFDKALKEIRGNKL